MVSSCNSEESLLASCAKFSRVRFSSQPQLRVPPLRLPVSSRSKPQDACALLFLRPGAPGLCSGRGLLLGRGVFWGVAVHGVEAGRSPLSGVGRAAGLKKISSFVSASLSFLGSE